VCQSFDYPAQRYVDFMNSICESFSRSLCFVCAVLIAFIFFPGIASVTAKPSHAIAMHGQPKYGADFTNFSYADPKAKRGGKISFATVGTFDSLNPLIIKGVSALGIRKHVYESLMARSYDEPFSLYGLIAKTIEVPDDRSWVSFTLRPEARFSDGTPITVDDVIFSLETLRDEGRPNHQFYYSKVVKIERSSSHIVKFIFSDESDRELPLILGLMPILPKHIYANRAFNVTSFDKPIGSGAYVVDKVIPGRKITYKRNPDYWASDLAVTKGRFNFDVISYDYYRDDTSAFEAFKSGLYDFRAEEDPTKWATAYDFKAVKDGRIVVEEFKTGVPSGLYGLTFNTRRAIFSDVRVRRAMTLLFDGPWINKNLYHGRYRRTQSYFGNSELSYKNQPASADELDVLAKAGVVIAPEFLNNTYTLPQSDGSGRNRQNLRKALRLFQQAGYLLKDGKLINKQTNKPFSFEVLVVNRDQERLVLSYATALKRAGIDARIRQVDTSQFEQRKLNYDFDMLPFFWFASLSPGNEQSFYWGSDGRTREGTRNYMGIEDKSLDRLIEALIEARDRKKFVTVARAIDRVLMSNYYVIPLFHLPAQWVAHKSNLRHPTTTSLYGYRIDTWWSQENQPN